MRLRNNNIIHHSKYKLTTFIIGISLRTPSWSSRRLRSFLIVLEISTLSASKSLITSFVLKDPGIPKSLLVGRLLT